VAGIDQRYYYVTFGLLALCTIVGLAVAFRFQREVDHDLAPSTEKDLLEPLEKAYYSGLMDEAEFQRIREAMERLKPGQTASAPKPPPHRPKVEPPSEIVTEPSSEPDTESAQG